MKHRLFSMKIVILLFCHASIFAAEPAGDLNHLDREKQRMQISKILEQGQAFIANLSIDEIQNQFGAPNRRQTTFSENKFDSTIKDCYTVLVYQNFIFRIYHDENRKTEFVTHFSLLTCVQSELWRIQPGITMRELFKKIGEPDLREQNRLTWESTIDDEPIALVCHMRNDAVMRIDFSFYYE